MGETKIAINGRANPPMKATETHFPCADPVRQGMTTQDTLQSALLALHAHCIGLQQAAGKASEHCSECYWLDHRRRYIRQNGHILDRQRDGCARDMGWYVKRRWKSRRLSVFRQAV